MEYRAIRAEELPVYREFEAYCFQGFGEIIDQWMERIRPFEHTRALFAPDGQMLATLTNFPLATYMDGVQVPMGGIGGVASVPETRRGGYVGELLTRLIHEEKEKGVPLSALYPFKQSFYRRYGWEVAAAWVRLEMPIELLSRFRRSGGGSVRRYLPGKADWRELEAVYARAAAGRRGHIVRGNEAHWANRVNRAWDKEKWQTAVWRPTAQAEPEGYLVYRFGQSDGKDELVVGELIALTPAAEEGLWGFIANHDSQVQLVRHRVPRDYPVWHLVENTYEAKSIMQSGWMLRLVDLKSAFEATPWPQAARGALTISVTDAQAPWNQGTWRFTFSDGRVQVTPAPAEIPVLSTDIQTLAQMYSGLVRPHQAAATQKLVVSDPAALDLLGAGLAAQPMFFYEFF